MKNVGILSPVVIHSHHADSFALPEDWPSASTTLAKRSSTSDYTKADVR